MTDEEQCSARLDYDLLVVNADGVLLSIAPLSIAAIELEHDHDMNDSYVYIKMHSGGIFAHFYFDSNEDKAIEWHAHLHNLWRDARIVAARAR